MITHLPNKFVILDTEYTSWEGSMRRNWSESWEARETVQIAAMLVEQEPEFAQLSSFSVTLRPKKNPVLSEYFTALTGITQSDLDSSIEYEEAIKLIVDLSEGGSLPIYTWGDGDESSLKETAAIQGQRFPTELNAMKDVRDVFEALDVSTAGYQSGTIYQALKLPSPGQAHNALDDVLSIFVSLKSLS